MFLAHPAIYYKKQYSLEYMQKIAGENGLEGFELSQKCSTMERSLMKQHGHLKSDQRFTLLCMNIY